MDRFEEHIVAFIDFLGFQDFNEKETIETKLEFIKFLREIKNLDSDAIIRKKSNVTEFRVASSFFSDSLVLAWPLKHSELPIDRNINESEIINYSIIPYIAQIITQIAFRALYFGLLIRGAITVGEFYHKDQIFLGNALNHAHYLESKIAIYPRVIIANDIFEKRLITPLITDIICKKLYLQDPDGVNYLNYFYPPFFRQAFWPSATPNSMIQSLKPDEALVDEKIRKWILASSRIINKKINLYRTQKKIKELQKWLWFSEYFKKLIVSLSKNASWTAAKEEYLVENS